MTVPYSLDLTTAQEDARNVIAKLKSADVTSVILAGDPVFPTFLTKEATVQGYFPEWVVLGYAFTDTAVFGRQYDQKQWAHAFGVSLLPTRTTDEIDELANLITWQTGHPPPAKTFRELVQAPLIFFTGVHLAGPHLTAKTFEAGLFRFARRDDHGADAPAPLVGPPRHLEGRRPHRRRRRDRVWWDSDRDRPRRGRPHRQRPLPLRRRRARYLPGKWPKRPISLYDASTSVTVLTQLPPELPVARVPRPLDRVRRAEDTPFERTLSREGGPHDDGARGERSGGTAASGGTAPGREEARRCPAASSGAVSVSLGVYGRLHDPTGEKPYTLCSSPASMQLKVWLATAVVALAIVQVLLATPPLRTRSTAPRTAPSWLG